ncbi:MAG: steroid 5-alpha reductase family enzyme [Paraglaciecola sp.]|jgi:steroid 5-alpha reductase family enzyme
MSAKSLQYFGIFVFVVFFAALFSFAGSAGGVEYKGLSVFVMCTALAFGLQWLMFIPAYKFQTEHYYDLTGSVSYLAVIVLALTQVDSPDSRAIVLGVLVAVWALRLGSFLFMRIAKDGSDSRFDEIKPVFWRFLNAWTLQGLWVIVTAGCAIAAITSQHPVPLGVVGISGVLLWLTGFMIEVVADQQKRRKRRDPNTQGTFIQSGLWAYSRHPNYFGEIVLWIGIAMIAYPALAGWQHVTLLSPLFVVLLLSKVSGIPLLEAKADARWQGKLDYQEYKARTPVLIPRLKK